MTKNSSVIRLTDETATTAATYGYDSWGNTVTASGAQANNNSWQYAGGYKDTTTGLTKFGARYSRGNTTTATSAQANNNPWQYAGEQLKPGGPR